MARSCLTFRPQQGRVRSAARRRFRLGCRGQVVFIMISYSSGVNPAAGSPRPEQPTRSASAAGIDVGVNDSRRRESRLPDSL